jgi:aminomethyltransferase
MTTMQLKETALASTHKKMGARMVDFAGWNMPVQYKSIISEHMAVRNKVGLFDVSHMGEFLVSGQDAHNFVQYVIANDVNKLKSPNCALYTQFVKPDGGTIDDLIVYRREHDFLLVVNASNIEKDWQWLQKHSNSFKDLKLTDISDRTGLLALQGPKAQELLSKITSTDLANMPSFAYDKAKVNNFDISFGRTGYTGEDGFEIFVDVDHLDKLWQILFDVGNNFGIEACGLGARDTLRLEAGLPLYGHELDESTSPLEAGLDFSVKLDKGEFLGKDALYKQKELGLTKKLIGLRTESQALPRAGYEVNIDGTKIGTITSGSQGIFVGYPIAFAYVEPKYAKLGQILNVTIRNNDVKAEVIKRPFYKRCH